MIAEDSLISAILTTRSQVDFLWQFFVSAQVAIFALLLIYDDAVERLSVLARAASVVGVGLFDWINGNALINTYRLLDAMHDQYRALYGAADRFRPAFFEQFVQASFAGRPDTVLITHGIAFAIVFLAVVSNGFIQSKPRTREITDTTSR